MGDELLIALIAMACKFHLKNNQEFKNRCMNHYVECMILPGGITKEEEGFYACRKKFEQNEKLRDDISEQAQTGE